ncbi:hypothetical protein AZE42_04060 [Rhizopogon vesiculosus]|uniref:GCF C-terminal domain-containing protein n=1 Tax=Rhizopogon vesiculosus TaxID=180088 RepID=A0A1J8PVS4_9AGAM|nr:hypothetical protein AZE42_04060 [Rhizopogon vesiculosus]
MSKMIYPWFLALSQRQMNLRRWMTWGGLSLERTPAAVRHERRAARITRRIRRERERGTKNVGTQQNQEEGYSTDSSSPPSDAMDYQSAMEKITSDGHNLLPDVHPADFRDPSSGLAKWFCEWRGRFGSSYTGVWSGLGLVCAWESRVRPELLGWNPLETSQNIDEFSRCASLYEYSRLRGDKDEDRGPDVGPDGDLISAMISAAIVPFIYDPESVCSVFEHSISTSESSLAPFIALNRSIFDSEAITARQRLLRHASKFLDTLVQWRKYTGEILGIGELCVRHVNNIAIPIAESGWDVGGEEIAREMVAVLPVELNRALKAPLSALASGVSCSYYGAWYRVPPT